MKLEFFADAFEGAGLLLLHSGSSLQVERLREQLRQLAAPGTKVRLHNFEFIEALDSCELTFSSANSGCGVQSIGGPPRFELQLSPDEWERVSELLEPFCNSDQGKGTYFQYLNAHGGVEVIYSTARQW